MFDIKIKHNIDIFPMSSHTDKKGSSKAKKNADKDLEHTYQKMDQHEHILKKPGMYIGSVRKESSDMWIYNEKHKETEPAIIKKQISFVPALYKIYDEILVNARDHYIRTRKEKEKNLCTTIKVSIDKESGKITVMNNGDGLAVAKHPKHKSWIPTMLFGELLSSTNYNDKEEREVGGTNGLGSKLTNIYSSYFEIDVIDATRDLHFNQIFRNNMYESDEPVIVSAKGKKSHAKFTFIPDYEKFGLKGLTTDIIALFKKRVYDIAMNAPECNVYFNDEKILTNSFTKYIDMYYPDGSEKVIALDTSAVKWKVAAIFDPTDTIEHHVISFVNGICTYKGGHHVNHVVDPIVTHLKNLVIKKTKNNNVKPQMIKDNLVFFIDCTIVNPEFTSQTKEELSTKKENFGSTYTATDKFIKAISKSGVVDQICALVVAKAEANLGKGVKKTDTYRHEKHYPAEMANTKTGHLCTLILTEGDSAKAFAMAGLNVIGRKYYGVFPLKGKLKNVRDMTADAIIKNEEVEALVNLIGLEYKKEYKSVKGLKYGRIMILTDQDVDGSHIKGLLMNFVHYYCPSLIKTDGFITSLPTPLIKVSKGKGKNRQVVAFMSASEYEEWKCDNNDGRGWKVKYYKGLGTSDSKEAQECFQDMDSKLVTYYWLEQMKKKNKQDLKTKTKSEMIDEESDIASEVKNPGSSSKIKDISEDAIRLAFEKKREDDRKLWLGTYDPKKYIDTSMRKVSYYDFIHKELIAFSVYNVSRAIPNIIDGFKPSQRKVYYGTVKKNVFENELKVAQLGAAIAESSHYHHGEKSLYETIIGMAQNFVGSNNLNILDPVGQFGTRLQGGKDAASERYIETKMNPLSKKLFNSDDTAVLEKQFDGTDEIEPMYYAPIMPLILINGSEGIGTGYSTTVNQYNPRDIYNNIIRLMDGEKIKSMKPWFRNFSGSVEKTEQGKYVITANYKVIGEDSIQITDLPIGTWTDNYKVFLENLLEQSQQATKDAKRDAKRDAKNVANKKKPAAKKTGAKSIKGKAAIAKAKALEKKSKASQTARVAKTSAIAASLESFTEDCTDVRINFIINFKKGHLSKLIKKNLLEKELKLTTTISTTNMHLFDSDCKIKKYDTVGDILREYYATRLTLYAKRKDYLLGKWRHEMDILKWRVQFIEDVLSGKIVVFEKNKPRKRAEVLERLAKLSYPEFAIGSEKTPSYNYITSTGLFNLTEEEVEKLRKQFEEKKAQIEELEGKEPVDIWRVELEEFMTEYDKWETDVTEAYEELCAGITSGKSKKNKKTNKSVIEIDE